VLGAEERHAAARVYEPAKPQRRWGLVAFLVALVLLAGGVGIYYLVSANRVETVAVPWVVDRKEDDAKEALIQARLQPHVVQVTGPDDSSKGRVTKQSLFDTTVQIGTEVVITVNVGPTKGVIPLVKGMPKDDAVKQLNESGFANVTLQADPDEPLTAKADEVTKVDPAEGASVTLDTPITVYFATGMGVVPTLTNFNEADARRVAKNAGFGNVKFDSVETAAYPAGFVFEQNPPVGSTVKRTTTIRLKIATAPPTAPPSTAVPSVTPTPTVP
jgi:serine/threonine-protein kinase